MSLPGFLAQLGSQSGAPGGGAAAALTGSAGAALVEMTARLNDKRLKRSSGNAAKAASLRQRLHALIAEDAEAFARIQNAWKTRRVKGALWQAALKSGAGVPLRVCEACAQAASLAKKERSRTSAWLESDRREALVLLKAAFDAGKLNVDVNLREMKDRAYAKTAQRKLKAWRRSL